MSTSQRIEQLEKALVKPEAEPRMVVVRPGETVEEALARVPTALFVVPDKAPMD